MESVGVQYGADEFVEEPVNDGRFTSPRAGAHYPPENFYDAAWYASSGGGGGGAYGPASSGSYQNVNHPSQIAQQTSHEHYGMSPHSDAPHMSTTPQPLPPMSSFRGGSTNGPATSGNGPVATNPVLGYNATLAQHAQSHNLQNDTLVGKALQSVNTTRTTTIICLIVFLLFYRCIQTIKASAVTAPTHQLLSIHRHH